MNKKQLTILIALVAAVGLGGLAIYKKQQAAWTGGGSSQEKLLAGLPVGESLAQVVIRHGSNEVNLVKQGDIWRVKERGDYPANYGDISSTILKLRDLKAIQTEQVGASQLGRLELLPPGPGSNTATQVEFRDAAGKALNSLLLGKTQMREGGPSQFGGEGGGYPAGRWIMLDSAKDSVALVSDPLSSLAPKPGAWLNKEFLKVEKIKSVSVSYPETTNSWSVSRTNEMGNDWVLADAREGETLDSSKTGGFGWALSSSSFTDVVVDPNLETLGLEKPTTIQIETFEGFTYTLKVGSKNGDGEAVTVAVSAVFPKERTPAADEKPEDKAKLDKEFQDNLKKLEDKLAATKAFEKWTYLVPTYTLDSLLKKRADLFPAKTADTEGGSEASEAEEPPVSLGIPPAE